MVFESRRSGLVFAGVILTVAAAVGGYAWDRASRPLTLDAPPPRITADLRDSTPADPPSVIEAQVTYNLDTARQSLEAAVPTTFGDIERKQSVPGNARESFAFALSRSPFRVRLVHQKLMLSADIEYEGRVWYRPVVGPELSAGCGTGDAPRPRVRATLLSTGVLTPHWQLRTHTRVSRLEPFSAGPRDRCRLSVLRLDETRRVISGTRALMDGRLVLFDQAVSRWPVRAKFDRLWLQMQRPIRLTEGVYLMIDPFAARLGEVTAVGDTATVRLGVFASPHVVTGVPSAGVLPLPVLQPGGEAGRGAHVAIEGSFSYPVATALLRRVLVGRSIVQAGRRIRIQDVQLSGIGGGRVAMAVTLAGRVRGRLYLTGTPRLDPARHQIDVPDLDYDVGTSQMLVRGLGWLRGVDIRDFLRARAQLPDSAGVGRLRRLAQNGVNRVLAPGVTLSGTIHDARGTGVRATTREIRVRAVADAEFKLAIDRAPMFPPIRRAPRAPLSQTAGGPPARPR